MTRLEPTDGDGRANESRLLATESRWAEWLALALLVVILAIRFGPVGIVAGLVTTLVWVQFDTPYAVATGILFAIAFTPDGIDPTTLSLVGAGLLGLVLAPMVAGGTPRAAAISVLLPTGVLGALTWLLVAVFPLWLSGLAVLGTGTSVVYGLARYQKLRLGLLDDELAKSISSSDKS